MTAARRNCVWAGIALALLAGPPVAAAHPLAPVLLELSEVGPGRFDVTWKRPLRVEGIAERAPELPAECARLASSPRIEADLVATERWVVDCGEGGLVGRPVAVRGLEATGTDALLRIALSDGRVIQTVLRPDASSVIVPERTPPLAIARDYAGLGFEHILGGADHLLFVFGLLLLVGGGRRLLQTVTAFTVGHSVTLSLAALGYVRYPVGPIEVAIAATIFWLAVELARSPGEHEAWIRRAPWLAAGVFGLLHGLGFAGALAAAGLPSGDVPLALFAFNAGIETGQLAFVGAVLSAWALLRVIAPPVPVWGRQIPVYVMGSLAAFWCLERMARLVP